MSNQVIVTLTKSADTATIGTYSQWFGFQQLASQGKVTAEEPAANTMLCQPYQTFVATIADPGENLDPASLDGPIVTEFFNLLSGRAEAIPAYLPLSCLASWIRGQVGNDTKIEINYGKSATKPMAVN